MKQVNELIGDPRMREEFERFYNAKTAEERKAITEEHKRWFESLSDEEKKLETTRMYDSVRAVLEGVKANNEELKNYFGKTKTWLYQRLNGNKVNGKEARFTESEARQLQEALHDIGHRLTSIILI